MIRSTDKADDEEASTAPCIDGNSWDFDEIDLGEQEEDDGEQDDENRSGEDESDEKENIASSSPKGASLSSAMGILSPSSFEIRQNARRLLDDTSKRRRLKRRQSTSVLRRPLQPSSVGNRMVANRDNRKGVGKETQAQSTKKALRHLQSELGLTACSISEISAEIDADLAEIKEVAQEMANTFLEVGEDAIGIVKDGISEVGSLFDGLWE